MTKSPDAIINCMHGLDKKMEPYRDYVYNAIKSLKVDICRDCGNERMMHSDDTLCMNCFVRVKTKGPIIQKIEESENE